MIKEINSELTTRNSNNMSVGSKLEITKFDMVDKPVYNFVINGLKGYNDKFSIRNQLDFSIVAECDNITIAAVIGESKYDWLIIQYIFVNEIFRNNGIGSKLINAAIDLAKMRKCKGIHLDTFEFQARDFYIKQGFHVFGEIEDHPSGYKRFFLKIHFN